MNDKLTLQRTVQGELGSTADPSTFEFLLAFCFNFLYFMFDVSYWKYSPSPAALY